MICIGLSSSSSSSSSNNSRIKTCVYMYVYMYMYMYVRIYENLESALPKSCCQEEVHPLQVGARLDQTPGFQTNYYYYSCV